MNFVNRANQIEIMDDLDCKGEVVHQTLRELETINRLLGGDSVTLNGLERLLKNHSNGNKTITIADVGCGGGDMLMKINNWATKRNLTVSLVGIDANPHIIDYAITNCNSYSNITFQCLNVFDKEFQNRRYDVIIATLFTHHFSNDQLATFLRTAQNQTSIGVVINDIHRHWAAYYSILFLTRLFSRSAMVRFDAPLSVRRSFKKDELINILGDSGVKKFELRWKWAFRWQLIIPSSLA